jgi:hypothetical protein
MPPQLVARAKSEIQAKGTQLAPYALAPSGHAAVAPPSSVMSSRRFN